MNIDMKCSDIVDLVFSGESGVVDERDRELISLHIRHCDHCRDALRGVESTRLLKYQTIEDPDSQLFAKLMHEVRASRSPKWHQGRGFWLGAGIGGTIAAAVFAAAIALGFLGNQVSGEPAIAEFLVSTAETRELNIAIDTSTPLDGASVSVTFFGGVELAGYAQQRHLSWTTDLDAGINKLSLPIHALDDGGGQVIVRLDHPLSQQEFLVRLRTDS